MKAHQVTWGMTRVVVAVMALAMLTAPAWAGAVGGEFLVNTRTADRQEHPSLGMDASGNFVIAWQSNGQEGSGPGVYAQRHYASGVAQGSEFLVNTHTPSDQMALSVGMDASGNFVIAWVSWDQDGSGYGVYA